MSTINSVASGQQKNKNSNKGTQTHLRIGEIKNDVLVLKNGGMRAVLKTSSINFNLKSEDEQKAIISSYQAFLNSLEHPIQILVRSKKLDIDDYISQVEALAEKQKNQLLQDQTYEYAQYVQKLIDYADIMEKQFYVVIPYDPVRARESLGGLQGFWNRLYPKDNYTEIKKRQNEFEETKKSLTQRVNTVSAGLESVGLKVEQLTTQELIELFYNTYNPITSQCSKIKDLENSSLTESQLF